LQNFQTYRCLQVLNAMWLDLSTFLIPMMLLTLAVQLIGSLFLLIRGGLSQYSTVVNTIALVLTSIGVISLSIGGSFFFHFSLALNLNSNKCWVRFLRSFNNVSSYDKAFYKSCRPISMAIGSFFEAKNRAFPLVYFGQMVVKTTIELLLVFRQ